jgi:enterochelin esterase-like enzyme
MSRGGSALNKRITSIVAILMSLLFWTSEARGQKPQALVSGLSLERILSPGENQVYTVTLQEGSAVVGEADQHGVDLVVDVFGPDGTLINTVDSGNGTEGPEPIDVTAVRSGLYRLVIHTLDTAAKPGKYVIKVDRIFSAEENAQRLAEKNYPPSLQSLWAIYFRDPRAIDQFLASRKGKGPIVEEVKDDPKYVSVTYVFYGDDHTEAVKMWGGPHGFTGGLQMTRFLHTPMFFASEIVPKDARYTYTFAATEMWSVGPGGKVQVSHQLPEVRDPLNPDVYDGRSVLAFSAAPSQPYLIENASIPHGRLTPRTISSKALKEDRQLTIYTPPDYENTKESIDLLVVLDGENYDGGSSSSVPTPTILDNLIAAKKIPPTLAVFVRNTGHRVRDLAESPEFADFIAAELVSSIRKDYRIKSGADHVVTAGASLGGLAASYCALAHPEVIGNALSLSGSYWIRKTTLRSDLNLPFPLTLTGQTGDLIEELRNRDRLPLRFYVAVGRFELSSAQLGTNRELRDLLLLKGYPVTYEEVDGEHDNVWWRGSLADGLISLIGRQSN